ncbi:ABC transporter substrate-binding protein, partial [Tsukamurella pulmonis]
MRSRALLALPLIAAATVLAACGGSSDPAAESSNYPIP